MPKMLTDADLDEMENEAALDEFEMEFKRSRKGNKWRNFEGTTVSVFQRNDGFYGWSIADTEGVRYSNGGYDDKDDALIALAYELGVFKR